MSDIFGTYASDTATSSGQAMMVEKTGESKSFLVTVFQDGFNTILYALETIWPYLIIVAIVFMFWRVGKSFFRK